MKRFAFLVMLLLGSTVSFAQYPNKPIKFIVGFPPGGSADPTTRIVGAALQEALGQPIVVENRPGADSAIAARAGGEDGPRRLHHHVRLQQRHDRRGRVAQAGDVRPAQGLHADLDGRARHRVLLRASLSAGEDAEGIRRAREGQPRQARLRHRQPALDPLQRAAHAGDRHRHAARAVQGRRPAQSRTSSPAACTPPSSAPAGGINAKDGRLRALAVLLEKRSPLLPEVPTIAEAGVPEVTVRQWAGVFGPPKMPPEIVARLNKEVNALLKRPEVIEKLQSYGYSPEGSTPERLLEINRADLELWRRLVKEAGIALE